MATAIVNVLDRDKRTIQCRTLIDTCSNANFITDKLATKLRLPSTRASVAIGTLNQSNTTANRLISTTIKSRLSHYERNLTFFTIPQISESLPETQIDRAALSIPPNVRLADPQFHRPAPIDMLIGAGPALSCLSIGQYDLSPRNGSDLILQKTQLGWIIGGSVPTAAPRTTRNTFVATLNFDLKKFWEIEEGSPGNHLSFEERDCEDHFLTNIQRNEAGRYIVALPFNEKKDSIGESRSRALNRFFSLERKLNRDPELKRQYTAVIDEYRDLGHMTQVKPSQSPGFYLPHHSVVKPSSATTKVRVVFDGSAKSSSGLSLNDALRTGPSIQNDIFSLLLRFRMYAYVLTGDIEKMYRQFLVRPEDRSYQRILWRDHRNQVSTYELNTVTFGLAAAPYLAIRCIHQLAEDEQVRFPEASTVVKRDLYVDDLITGANSIEEAIRLRTEVIGLFNRGGLNIRQWASNEPQLLAGLNENQIHPKILGDPTTMKTLGISWDARKDLMLYTVEPPSVTKVTKRTVLSSIAKIFDPLGLLGPVTIIAKIFMQRLWQLKVDWDESLPASLHTDWTTFVQQLLHLDNVGFKRNTTQRGTRRIELHGFCDASERAYGACIYIRTIGRFGRVETNLLCAKSRVAPLKTVTLARLELCGAALLASLYATVREAITCDIDHVFLWTDSTIVLNWISKQPCLLKTFVANRVAEIQEKTEKTTWRHVRTQDNPADLLSRGQLPTQFKTNALWRHGPKWLSNNASNWPESKVTIVNELPELKRITCLTATVRYNDDVLHRYSCINKLRRIIAYCLRVRRANRATGPLTTSEVHEANLRIVRLLQATSFAKEISCLRSDECLPTKSKLIPLNPFLDDQGILRVGGRLQNSTLPFSQKHPILLPKGHHITTLIIRDAHCLNHHAGITSTLCIIRQAYWPIDGKNATRKIVRQCVKCFRHNPPDTNYRMGNLPASRVTENRPFSNCGIDYCGPFFIKERRHRNRARVKVYVAVFVCLATKAVHLEVVSDLTTDAFLAALKRFVGRRGICKNIYSDNGSNFIGANNELLELHEALQKDNRIRNFLIGKEITWHFMPPLSPHFGGLWEAAVKSFKHHLKRVVGDELFTYEQFETFAIEIEAILNSRPLTPLSSDPNDPSALTPSHFLIGNPLTSLPESDFRATPANRLSSWQHIQKVKQDFWTRWHKEYISHLNVRHKWAKGSHTIKEGTVVVLKEDHLPPLSWHLGRVQIIHPGTDGIVRAVTVRTANGIYKRNVKQLAPLPLQDAS
ncbi:hypothetical protein ANTRET_LOCUS8425 [Anthophora retusa]